MELGELLRVVRDESEFGYARRLGLVRFEGGRRTTEVSSGGGGREDGRRLAPSGRTEMKDDDATHVE